MAASALNRVRDMAAHLSLRPFDTTTEAGRAAERHRRVALSALASAAARGTSILTALVSVPLTLHYLGPERYGMWLTMSSVTAMLSFADFGIGNGVLSAVASASGREALEEIRAYVSSAFALLGTISLVILGLIAAASGLVDWGGFFNVTTPLARAEAAPAIAVFVGCFALSLPFTIVQRVQMGLQMGFMASLWQCAASVTALVGVIIAISLEAGLPWLVLALAGAPVLIAAINSAVFFARVRPQFAPRRGAASRRHGAELARTGSLFFVLQVVVAVAYMSDNLVIARMLGAGHVAQYGVPDRLFALASMIVGFAVTPLWPAFGEALSRGDRAWARRTLVRATIVSASVAGAMGVFLVVAGPLLLHWWVGPSIQPPFFLLLGFAVWRTVEASVGASSMFLNGMRAVGFQVVTAILTAAGAITLKIFLLPQFGIQVIPWVTICVYLLCTGLPMFFFLRARA
ncbi:oligosaccharide flippase family protein [uncultured Sphingomonas sp.]|uniref:lipopolysaccharide biosynthesis protein n=1 Tax=uncultured Sphingomonas sp. TaxID=158754 RepID=UPI0025D62D11|nr:oligosaccharide flippase family protein [uncultured Sphingomonas sp.]